MGDQQTDSWIQWQGAIEMDSNSDHTHTTASSAYGSENCSTNLTESGEENICPPYPYSSDFDFDHPSFLPVDHSLSLPWPPIPIVEPDIQPLQDVVKSHSVQTSLAKTENLSLEDTELPDSLPDQPNDTSKNSWPASSHSTRSLRTRKKKPKPKPSTDIFVPRAPNRESHNAIEKKYRKGLNECFDRLRHAIPPPAEPTTECKSDDEDEDDGSVTEKESKAPQPKPKDGKAQVLIRALEYIQRLEGESKRLCSEVDVLENRLKAFEDLAMNRK